MVDGLRPCIPGGTGSTCRSCPRREMYPCGTCYPCPGGEDHLKRRSSSPPVPPLLGCRHCPEKGGSACFAPKHKLPSALGTCLVGTISAARVPPRGCKGRSPLHKKTKKFPPSRREGGQGGWGQQSKLKAGRASAAGGKPPPLQAPQRQGLYVPQAVQRRGAGGKPPRPPLRVPDWQRQPATEKKTPPPETTGGGVREKSIS